VNSVMNLRVSQNAGNYRMAEQLVASRAVLSSTDLVSYVNDIRSSLMNLHGFLRR
jgi:hypothetical protein